MANNILDLRMGVDAKLTDEVKSKPETGVLSYAVDKQNLYIDALKEDKVTIERQMVNADKAYAIRNKVNIFGVREKILEENIVAKPGEYNKNSFLINDTNDKYYPVATVKLIEIVDGSVDLKYKYKLVSGTLNSLSGQEYFIYCNDDKNYHLLYSLNTNDLTLGIYDSKMLNLSMNQNYQIYEYRVGSYSTAEGYSTIANGYSSHAEGFFTKASGSVSHAEGVETNANGYASHAEGYSTIASGDYSHAGGKSSSAIGENSFAFGNQVKASGENSFVFGSAYEIQDIELMDKEPTILDDGSYGFDLVSGANIAQKASIAFNSENNITANILKIDLENDPSRIYLDKNILEGDTIVNEEGHQVISIFGTYGESSGKHSMSFGIQNNTLGENSFAIGKYNEAIGNHSFALGKSSIAQGENSLALNGQSYGGASIALNGGMAIGNYSYASGMGVGLVLILPIPLPSISLGDFSYANGYHAQAIADGSTAIGYAPTAEGKWSFSITGDALGEHSFVHSDANYYVTKLVGINILNLKIVEKINDTQYRIDEEDSNFSMVVSNFKNFIPSLVSASFQIKGDESSIEDMNNTMKILSEDASNLYQISIISVNEEDRTITLSKPIYNPRDEEIDSITIKFGQGISYGANSFSINNSVSYGIRSFSQGSNTQALGYNSASFGKQSIALGRYSLASGYNTKAIADYSVAIGKFNDYTFSRDTISSTSQIRNFELEKLKYYIIDDIVYYDKNNGEFSITLQNDGKLLTGIESLSEGTKIVFEKDLIIHYFTVQKNGGTPEYYTKEYCVINNVSATDTYYTLNYNLFKNYTDNLLFIIGNGTDEEHLSNAFTVDDTGHTKTNKITASTINVQNEIKAPDGTSLVSKKQLKEELDKLVTNVWYKSSEPDNTKTKLFWIRTGSDYGNGVLYYYTGGTADTDYQGWTPMSAIYS